MRRSTALLAAALLPALAQGCTGETIEPVITPVAADQRRLTVTLLQCDCATCRVAVRDVASGRVVHTETDPPVGVAVVADACYAGPTAEVILECGSCAGGSACTAVAALAAGGQTAGQATCDTLAQAGASCADVEEMTVDGSPTNPDCEL